MLGKFLIAGSALAAIAALTLMPAPAVAGCNEASGTARGLNQDDVMARSAKHLERKINHWAHKNGLTSVHVGSTSTTCVTKAGALSVCTSGAKVCS
jgi:hypothetical protein